MSKTIIKSVNNGTPPILPLTTLSSIALHEGHVTSVLNFFCPHDLHILISYFYYDTFEEQ